MESITLSQNLSLRLQKTSKTGFMCTSLSCLFHRLQNSTVANRCFGTSNVYMKRLSLCSEIFKEPLRESCMWFGASKKDGEVICSYRSVVNVYKYFAEVYTSYLLISNGEKSSYQKKKDQSSMFFFASWSVDSLRAAISVALYCPKTPCNWIIIFWIRVLLLEQIIGAWQSWNMLSKQAII